MSLNTCKFIITCISILPINNYFYNIAAITMNIIRQYINCKEINKIYFLHQCIPLYLCFIYKYSRHVVPDIPIDLAG